MTAHERTVWKKEYDDYWWWKWNLRQPWSADNQGLLANQPFYRSVNDIGFTCLHYAALHQDIHMAQLLISKNADTNLRDNHGNIHMCD